MGFGHRVYRAEDPRARVLRRTAKELGAPRFEVAEALEKAALAELHARKPDRVLATNVEFWSAVVLDFAEVPRAHVHLDVHLRPGGRLERAHPGAEEARAAGPPVGDVRRPARRASRTTSRAGTTSRTARRLSAVARRVPVLTTDAVGGPRGVASSALRSAPPAARSRARCRRITRVADMSHHPDSRRDQARRRPVRLRAEQGPARGRRGARRRRHHATSARPTGRRRCGTRSPGCAAGIAELFALPDGLRGHPRQRRHHRVLGGRRRSG